MKEIAIAVGAIVALAGYAFYFDQKRRSDPVFRKKLRQLKKEDEKIQKAKASSSGKQPLSQAEQEQYFFTELTKGETLCKAGPGKYSEAAVHFLNALKVYPNPQELLDLLQRTIPPQVYMELMNLLQQEIKSGSSGKPEGDDVE